MAKTRLTRRHVDNMRAETARLSSYTLKRLEMSVIGKEATEQCECGIEHLVFEAPTIKLDASQVKAATFLIDKVFPSIKDEDLEQAVDEFRSDDAIDSIVNVLRNDTTGQINAKLKEHGLEVRPILKVVKSA